MKYTTTILLSTLLAATVHIYQKLDRHDHKMRRIVNTQMTEAVTSQSDKCELEKKLDRIKHVQDSVKGHVRNHELVIGYIRR